MAERSGLSFQRELILQGRMVEMLNTNQSKLSVDEKDWVTRAVEDDNHDSQAGFGTDFSLIIYKKYSQKLNLFKDLHLYTN